MPPSELKDDVRRRVEEIIAAEPSFPFVLGAVRRWPAVVYLEPQPDDPFRRLTAALADAFPDYPPYEGIHEEIIPHLTVAADVPEDYYEAAEHALPGFLPIRDVCREAWLIGHTPGAVVAHVVAAAFRPFWRGVSRRLDSRPCHRFTCAPSKATMHRSFCCPAIRAGPR